MSISTQMKEIQEQVETFHKNLPADLRQWLKDRCISDRIIDKFKLGYDGKLITIPITEETGAYSFFKYRKDPRNKNSIGQKYTYTKGSRAELYGWENLDGTKQSVVLCEGELDRLVLEDQGISAVTSTGGAGTFKDEWVKYFGDMHMVYICYDRDEAGQTNAEKISKKIPNSRVVTLPDMGEGNKDITDYFKSGHTKEDFEQLLSNSKTSEDLEARSVLRSLTMQGQPIDFNLSQQVVGNKLYLTIPAYLQNHDEKSNDLFTKLFLVISSERETLKFTNKKDFYKKYGFSVKELPQVKHQEVRWFPHHVAEYVDGYTPDPYEVFVAIRDTIRKYSEIKNIEYYDVLTLWIMGTYLYQGFETFPYLGVTGMQGSGKTKVLDILTFLCFNAQSVVSPSEASFFRDIDSLRPTLILDEGEYLNDSKNKSALVPLLNSGYSRGPGVPRQETDNKGVMSTRYFKLFSPKAIGNIVGFEAVLNSRIINIPMIRASGNRGSTRPTQNSEDWAILRHGLYSYSLSFFKDIQKAYLDDPLTQINNNRSNDLWSPLLSIALLVFRQRPAEFESLKEFAQKEIIRTSRSSLDEPTKVFLAVLRDLVTKDDWYEVNMIHARVANYFSPKEAEGIRPQSIGYMLRNFGFEEKDRKSKGWIYYFKVEQVKDLLNRYKHEIGDFEDESIHAYSINKEKVSGVSGQPVFTN